MKGRELKSHANEGGFQANDMRINVLDSMVVVL